MLMFCFLTLVRAQPSPSALSVWENLIKLRKFLITSVVVDSLEVLQKHPGDWEGRGEKQLSAETQ